MKITAVKAHPAAIPYKVARVTAQEPMRGVSVVLVEVATDAGISGIGQIHGAPLKEICEWVERLGEVACGMDALAHETVWEKLFLLTCPRPGGVHGTDGLPPPLPRGARPQVTAAIAGIDIALWDIKGKAAGMPVYRLLGGTAREVPTYATGGYYRDDGKPDGVAEEVAAFVARGYRAVKIKVGGQTIAEDVERVRISREACGSEVLLLLDMTAAYDLESAIRFAREVERHDPFWLEEPLHWYYQPRDFASLGRTTRIPLAHCERDLTRCTVRDFIVEGGVRYVQYDSTRHGGFTESLRIAMLAAQFGARISPHQAPELHAHLCSAFPGTAFAVETNGVPDPLSAGMYLQRAEIVKGCVRLGDSPGFGIEIDWDFIRRHAPP